MSKAVSRHLLTLVYCTLTASLATTLLAGELKVKDSSAKTAQEMKTYDEQIEHTTIKIRMLPIPGGEFVMGSPADEADRNDDETQHKVKLDPFWMAETETTWDAYLIWMYDLDIAMRKQAKVGPNAHSGSSLGGPRQDDDPAPSKSAGSTGRRCSEPRRACSPRRRNSRQPVPARSRRSPTCRTTPT